MMSSRKSRLRAAFAEGWQALEPRLLYAAGQLDPSFGTGGIAMLPMGTLASIAAVDGTGDRYHPLGAAVSRTLASGAVDDGFGSGGSVTLAFNAGDILPQPDGSAFIAGIDGRSIEFVHVEANGAIDSSFGAGGLATISPIPADSDATFSAINIAQESSGTLVFAAPAFDESLLPSPASVSLYLGSLPANGIGGTASGGDSLDDPQLKILPNGDELLYASTVVGQEAAAQNYLLDSGHDIVANIGPQGGLEVENFPAVVDADGRLLTYTLEGNHNLIVTRSSDTGAVDTAFANAGSYFVPDDVTAPLGIAPEPDGGLMIAYEHAGSLNDPTGLAFLRLKPDGSPDAAFAPRGLVYALLDGATISFARDPQIEDDGDLALFGTKSNGEEVELHFEGTAGTTTHPTVSAVSFRAPALGRKYAYVTVTFSPGAAALNALSGVPGTIGTTVRSAGDYYDPPTNAALVSVAPGTGGTLTATYTFLFARRGFSVRYAGSYEFDVLADAIVDADGEGDIGGFGAAFLVNFPRRAHGRAVTTRFA